MKFSNKYSFILDGLANAKAKKLHGIRRIIRHFIDKPDQESSEVYPKFEDGEGQSGLKILCEGELIADISVDELKEILNYTREDDALQIDVLIKAAKNLPKFIRECGQSVIELDKASHAQELANRKDWRQFDREQNEADHESEIKRRRSQRDYDRETEKVIREDSRARRKAEKEEAENQGE